ncbi:MAG: LysE family translocator [Pseudohongiellaceae bacterium]
MDNPAVYFGVGLIACFIGTIPFGPINLTVVKTAVDYDARRGTQIALAASFVEVGMALIAICFGFVISAFLETNTIVKLIIAAAFIILSVVIFTKKSNPKLEAEKNEQQSFFKKGLLIASVNPQVVPFWIFALTAIDQYFDFDYSGIYQLAFLAGIFVGKFLALYGFVVASSYLREHLQKSSQLVNRLLAGILLFIGLSQGWSAINGLI